jgi:hypothetical protein
VSGPGTDVGTTPDAWPRPPRQRRWWLIALLVVGVPLVLVGALVLAFVLGHAVNNRPIPAFPSLAQRPDDSLHGTVAYFDGASRCVRVIAAAGRPGKDVLCVPAFDPKSAAEHGKPMPPQLEWLPAGRLVVTGVRMTRSPGFVPDWQKIVDVRAGTVHDAPASDVPVQLHKPQRPTVSPNGERIGVVSDAGTGKVGITLTQGGTTRTLLSAQGPGEYTYGLNSASWSPDWKWILADDGRLLVVTPSEPSTTRILAQGAETGEEPMYSQFAVTADDLLTDASGAPAAGGGPPGHGGSPNA